MNKATGPDMHTAAEPNTTPSFTAEPAKTNMPGDMRQRFTINPEEARVIAGKSGIIVAVPANAFPHGTRCAGAALQDK